MSLAQKIFGARLHESEDAMKDERVFEIHALLVNFARRLVNTISIAFPEEFPEEKSKKLLNGFLDKHNDALVEEIDRIVASGENKEASEEEILAAVKGLAGERLKAYLVQALDVVVSETGEDWSDLLASALKEK
jgi:hypothetical protein